MPSALISTGIQFPDNTIQRRAFPSGGILMWYGNIAAIPSGWTLCNGTSGTPDLRDRFVVGAGSSYTVSATGGANEVTLSVDELATHTHPVSATIGSSGDHAHPSSTGSSPNHTHGWDIAVPIRTGPSSPYTSGGGGVVAGGVVNYSPNHTHALTNSDAAGVHSHAISVSYGNFGTGDAHENRPPFYALVFIMKV